MNNEYLFKYLLLIFHFKKIKLMKEKDENSYSEDYSTKNLDVTINSINKFTHFLDTKDSVTVHIEGLDPIYINLKIYSFLKINQMIQAHPEETIFFLFKKIELFTPRNSLQFSRSSIQSNKEANSSFSSLKLQSSKKRSQKEEIINTDIIETNNNNINNDEYINKFSNKKSRNNNNIIDIGNEENIDNIKIENEMIVNNIKRLKLFESTSDKNNLPKIQKIKTSADPKLVLFKWIYHFYIILSCLIFLHYLSFIFFEYNNASLYKLISILLIISLIYVGYIGIKYKYSKPPFFIFNDNYLFWVHFFILILTVISFISLIIAGGNFELIKRQGIFGFFIFFIYLISLIIEGYYSIYYDVIIEDIIWDKINNNKNKINNYIDNNLNIQLTDIE